MLQTRRRKELPEVTQQVGQSWVALNRPEPAALVAKAPSSVHAARAAAVVGRTQRGTQ